MASCVTTHKVNYMQPAGKRNIPTYPDTIAYSEYTLRTGDRIYVYVYSPDETISRMYNAGSNSGSYRQQMTQGGMANNGTYELYSYLVDQEGYIDFSTIGKVYVHGLTTRQVKQELERQLATLLADTPGYSTISCEVNIVQRSFSLIGVQSGRYNITKEINGDTIDNPNKVQLVLSDIPTKGFHHGYRYASGYGYGYGYGSEYGYGYGRSTYGYGNYYGKSHRSGKHGHHYYNDEEEPENGKE